MSFAHPLALAAIAGLACVGIFVSFHMLRKQKRGDRGDLAEPSVVMTARAKLTGLPNALLGSIFYVAVLIATPFLATHLVWMAVFAAAALAGAFSIFLAFSLLFVTRMPCPYCWTGHVVNWLLIAMLWMVR